jgi:hypothetical protein
VLPEAPPAGRLATVTCLRPCYAFRRGRDGVMACVDCGSPKGSGRLPSPQYPGADDEDEEGEYVD